MKHWNAAWVLLLLSCGAIPEFSEFIQPDLAPPCLLEVRTLNGFELELFFDEPPYCQADWIQFAPSLAVETVQIEAERLLITVSEQSPGLAYVLEARVEDERGNSLSFLATIYGYNPSLPDLLINEFTTRGTGNHPDVVELKILEGGDMGGIVLYQGTPANWQDRLIFPSFPIEDGGFIVVHFKSSGLPEEIDETLDPTLSGGLDATGEAFDFWIAGGTGISGNNGVLSLYDRPGGDLIDGVLYSNRSSDSDSRYLGFGTRDAMERALQLTADGGWSISGDQVRPEDAVDPEGSTGTRSICRSSLSIDTEEAEDWHIVPTRGATFGMENSDEEYEP